MVSDEFPEKEKFPASKVARKNLLEIAQRETEAAATDEAYWGSGNSSLRESPYRPRNVSFESTFCDVLPDKQKNLKRYIEDSLRDKKGVAVGIEFGGPGSELFAGFSEGFFKKSLGVALVDARDSMRPDPRSRDEQRNHRLIPGNIFERDTYTRVGEWLKGDKADVIFERLLGAMEYVPREPHLIGKTFQSWYKLLNQGGILFAQVPKDLAPFVSTWKNQLQSDQVHGIELVCYPDNIDDRLMSFPLRMRKLAGAPDELPLLDLRTLTAISRNP